MDDKGDREGACNKCVWGWVGNVNGEIARGERVTTSRGSLTALFVCRRLSEGEGREEGVW